METKRLILALVLTFAVFFGWQKLFPQQSTPAPEVAETTEATQAQPVSPASTTAPAIGEVTAADGKTVTVTTPLYTADFNTQGGILEHFKLTNYKVTLEPLPGETEPAPVDMVTTPTLGLSLGELDTYKSATWDAAATDITISDAEKSITFTGSIDGYLIQRTLTFTADNYNIIEDVRVTSETASTDRLELGVTAATNFLSDASNMYNRTQIAWLDESGVDEETDSDDLKEVGLTPVHSVKWGGIDNNYFLMAIQPGTIKNVLTGTVIGEDTFAYTLTADAGSIRPGETKTFENIYYLGPKERDKLAAISEDLSQAVNFGWSGFVAQPMLMFLVWVNQFVNNWGIAIIVLTILVKLIFWPLSQKSYKSMEQMKKLQPMIQKLKDKHGDDKKALNQEMMQLYKTYKVNPAGGCLPMVVQIPVFFGLYRALLGAVELRHASFIDFVPGTDILWLADLSSKDPFYVTPIIMGATMLGQQLMSPSMGDPTQRKMMMLMPVVFTFMFLQFPSGLVIYWLVNNVLSILQQWMIGRSTQKA